MSGPRTERTPSGRVRTPPLYHVATTAEMREGDHSHDTWFVRVVHADIASQSLPMIVKRVPSMVTLAVELACGLAARELRLNVPLPGLVVAEREDLPGLDATVKGSRFLLVGSHYQRPDALMAEVLADDPAAEQVVWDRVCATPVGQQGAVWDELIANPDRHCENVLFDGSTWWLLDHDQALEPAQRFVSNAENIQTRQEAIAHNASVNQLADELMRRHGAQLRVLLDQCKRMASGTKRLQSLAQYSRDWTHPDTDIHHALELVSVVLGLIHLRMPALSEKVQRRLGPGEAPPTLWT